MNRIRFSHDRPKNKTAVYCEIQITAKLHQQSIDSRKIVEIGILCFTAALSIRLPDRENLDYNTGVRAVSPLAAMTDDDRTLPSINQQAFSPGALLGGKFKIIESLGTGGMGAVYKVHQVMLGQNYALKTLETQIDSDSAARRFQREARATALLDHSNLVRLFDFGLLESGKPYLVMELVEGQTLQKLLKEHGPLSIDDATAIIIQVCNGLEYAHQRGVVHRDIKPANIMVPHSLPLGSNGSVKILDFGIAKLMHPELQETQTLTKAGEIFGSPLYMSPEQCSGSVVNERSDIYSVGCVLFELLTGTPPHVGETALVTMMMRQSEKAPTLSEASFGTKFPLYLENFVARMLEIDPEQRYPTLGAVVNDLKARDATSSGATGFQTKAKASSKQGKSGPILILASVAFACMLLAGLGFFVIQRATKPKERVLGNNEPQASSSATAEDGDPKFFDWVTRLHSANALYTADSDSWDGSIKLNGNANWTRLPVRLREGEGIKFQCEGTWKLSSGEAAYDIKATGDPYTLFPRPQPSNFPLNDAKNGAVVCAILPPGANRPGPLVSLAPGGANAMPPKLSAKSVFEVGHQLVLPADKIPVGATFYFVCNDTYLLDNSGAISIYYKVIKPGG